MERRRATIRYQLVCQRHTFASSGKLDLSRIAQGDSSGKARAPSLSELGVQPHLRILDISGMPIDSLSTLAPQPLLHKLIADGTKINSCAGLSRHPRLCSVSFRQSPLADRPNFRLSICIAVGQHLMKINRTAVTESERREANQYPLIARTLVESGWDAETPMPSRDKFKALTSEFKVKLKGVDSEFRTLEAQRYLRPPPVLKVPEDRKSCRAESRDEEEETEPVFDGLIAELKRKFRELEIEVPASENEVLEVIERLGRIVRDLPQRSEDERETGEEGADEAEEAEEEEEEEEEALSEEQMGTEDEGAQARQAEDSLRSDSLDDVVETTQIGQNDDEFTNDRESE
jgi:hypothetical protein